jgi:hypothetical protein
MSNPKLVIVDGDDWVGFYLGGKLIWQGHSPNLNELSGILNQAGLSTQFGECSADWMGERSHMPDDLSEVELL